MPWITVPKCDMCGALRVEANHWWLLKKVTPDMMAISPLPQKGDNAPDQIIACGEKCLHNVVGDYVAKTSANWREGK